MLSTLPALLSHHPWADQVHLLPTIDSTNHYAKQLALQGAPEGTIILADHQSSGRGRLGRSFSSPAGLGIYLSLLLRPQCTPDALMHLTCAAGVYASRAVEETTGQAPKIKWTNDLVLGKQKLGGILAELSVQAGTGLVDWAIVGIGINCCQRAADFPPEIQDIACSLQIDTHQRAPLAAALIRQLWVMRQELWTHKDAILADFTQRCMTIGQQISLVQGDTVRHGTAIGIEPDGALLVRFPDGTEEPIASGEVSVRGMYGYV